MSSSVFLPCFVAESLWCSRSRETSETPGCNPNSHEFGYKTGSTVLFPDTESAEDPIEQVLGVNRAEYLAEFIEGRTDLNG